MNSRSEAFAAASAARPLPYRAAAADPRPVAVWLLCCCGMIFVMVLLGGITRLTLSGLSMTQWHPVTGIVPPLSHAAWLAEFERYQQIPQYKLLNYGMTLAQFKNIFWWEYFHRLWGRLIGFAYLLPLLWFIWRRQVPKRLILPLAGLFLLGAAQGGLGWYMVESGLVHRVEVSQYRLTAHLALALAIYSLGLWIALGILRRSTSTGRSAGVPTAWRRLGEALIALVAVTICAGGFVAGLNAGLVYNTFPLMDGSFVPAGYAQLHPFVRNWFENVAAVQFDHRILAMTTASAVLLLWAFGRRAGLPRPARLALHALLAVVALQFSLGLSTLLLVVPISLAAAHQGGAVLLLTAAIVFRSTLAAEPRPQNSPLR
ncbi:MAG TPA: COX15/CtaA family protein [Stellaceae bacterium]|nr:COX15/CtaA family protein [Stellaceae bacterium]